MQPASKAWSVRLLRMQEPIDFPSAFRRAGIRPAKFRGEVRGGEGWVTRASHDRWRRFFARAIWRKRRRWMMHRDKMIAIGRRVRIIYSARRMSSWLSRWRLVRRCVRDAGRRKLIIGEQRLFSVPARLGKGQEGAKEIGHNLARERPKFGHNSVRERHKIFYE